MIKKPATKTAAKAKSPAAKKKSASALTMGPLYFHWSPEKRRDFYFRVADEADVDTVYLGEVVCSKREPFFEDYLPLVAERLRKSGKDVVFSTLALVTSEREMKEIKERVKAGYMIEANDVACLQALDGATHVIGPYINVFNETARDFMIRNKAKRIVLPVEIPATSVAVIANTPKVETEMLVFGRQPLSVAMRCYSARSHGLHKDGCQFVCGLTPDGLATDTMDGQPILAVNGTQTMSHGYAVLLHELAALQKMGVSHFRLSPQDVDMVEVASLYRAVLNKKMSADEALVKLRRLTDDVPYVNGFLHGREGLTWVEDRAIA